MPRKRSKKLRSPVTRRGHNRGRQPANAGKTYPPEVLTPEEIKRLIQAASNSVNADLDCPLFAGLKCPLFGGLIYAPWVTFSAAAVS